jgi:hypothetical protein
LCDVPAGAVFFSIARSHLTKPARIGEIGCVTNDSESPPFSPHQARLKDIREALLHLHKTLMDSEKTAYEAVFGSISSSQKFLDLLMRDPWFAWLHSISELIVVIDEALEEQEPPLSIADANRLGEQVRSLLKTSESGVGFAKHYFDALQRDPDVVMAHADVVRTLKAT